jgi:hypothetical protein
VAGEALPPSLEPETEGVGIRVDTILPFFQFCENAVTSANPLRLFITRKIVPLARLYCSQLGDFVNWSNEAPGEKNMGKLK